MKLRWFHWAMIAGAGLWLLQRNGAAGAAASAEAKSERVGGASQSAAGSFSQTLSNLVGSLLAPPPAASAPAATTPAPVAQSTVAPTPQAASFLAPSSAWSLTEAQQSAGGM